MIAQFVNFYWLLGPVPRISLLADLGESLRVPIQMEVARTLKAKVKKGSMWLNVGHLLLSDLLLICSSYSDVEQVWFLFSPPPQYLFSLHFRVNILTDLVSAL